MARPISKQSYRDTLDKDVRERYETKLQLLGGKDPYEFENSLLNENVQVLPSITYPDIVNYLVFSPSPYTSDDLKSYKGLEAYNQFVCGWVRDKKCGHINGLCVVTAKVLHSQRLSDKPLRPWIIAKADGSVMGAHCTCMAGLGEVCTHVAALLFSVEATVKVRDSKTVTDEKAYWLLPSSYKNGNYKEVSTINFTSAKSMKKKLDEKLNFCIPNTSDISESPRQRHSSKTIQEPSLKEIEEFHKMIHLSGCRSVILSVKEPYSNDYVPKPMSDKFPALLTELYNDQLSGNDLCENELNKLTSDILNSSLLSVTEEQAKAVEQATRAQASTKLWFRFRAGRVTASRMRDVCHTNIKNPAKSLIRALCYPDMNKFSNQATKWGCDHETYAKEIFLEKFKKFHENVQLQDTGFFISTDMPHIGASPDGLITCSCCGSSVLEVKCPFCSKDKSLDTVSGKTFCLEKNSEGKLTLKRNHKYFYQVQTQMASTKLDNAYFIVWTEKELFSEQINFDIDFWTNISIKSKAFFETVLMKELIGKFYSSSPLKVDSNVQTNVAAPSEDIWCVCHKEESGSMIACDNETCPYTWFHYSCIGIKVAPKGEWFCVACRGKMNKTK